MQNLDTLENTLYSCQACAIEHLRTNIENNSTTFLTGCNNFLADLISNNGHISKTITDQSAFKVGENIAITPGKVIFQNDLMQLIQYLPTTNTVYAKPMLFIPPWINKYYILDLSPEKSLVKWLVDQGFTVFIISWVNADATLATKDWENYLLEGPMAALDIVTKTTKCRSVHLAGYCIGGTLLASTLAYMQYKADTRAASGSYFATMLDFASPGPLGTFVNAAQLGILKSSIDAKGYLDGKLLDAAFTMLRPMDLIWPYFVNHYLLKQTPKPFDVLFWNADATHVPKKVAEFYLQNMYYDNTLKIPNALKLNNVPIDLNSISLPTFFVSAEKDHIAPWQSTYAGVSLHGGKTTFVLSEPGHVVGIINPPEQCKYGFKTNTHTHPTPEQWLQTAVRHEGSWWLYWKQWLACHDDKQVQATNRAIPKDIIIEDAPGTYVLKRI